MKKSVKTSAIIIFMLCLIFFTACSDSNAEMTAENSHILISEDVSANASSDHPERSSDEAAKKDSEESTKAVSKDKTSFNVLDKQTDTGNFKNFSYWAKDKKEIKIFAKASIENKDLRYAFYFRRKANKKWNPIGNEYSKRTTAGFTAADGVDYQVKVIIKDKNDKTVSKKLNIDGKFSKLTNKTKIKDGNLKLGKSLKIAAKCEGGKGPYTYAYYFKRKDNKKWNSIGEEFTDNTEAKFKPAAATEYQVRVVITDSNGQAAVKKFDVNAVK